MYLQCITVKRMAVRYETDAHYSIGRSQVDTVKIHCIHSIRCQQYGEDCSLTWSLLRASHQNPHMRIFMMFDRMSETIIDAAHL
jgi:hypothetical protein